MEEESKLGEVRRKRKERELAQEEPSHLDPVPEELFNPTPEEEDQAAGFNLRLLYHPRSQYTPAQKIQAATLYLYYGNMVMVARVTKIPEKRLSKWKNHAVWWPDTLEKVKANIDDEIQAGYRKVLQDGIKKLHEKIIEGEDTVVQTITETTEAPNGDKQSVQTKVFEKKPIPSKDLNRIVGTIQDKLMLIQGKPTSISSSSAGPEAFLDKIGKRLEKLAKAELASKQLNSIEGEKS